MWMARVAAFVGVGLLALAPGTAREAPLLSDAQARDSFPLLGVAWSEGGASLVSVDPRSLWPIPGRALPLFGAGAWAYSPDRTRLALAGSCQIGVGLSAGIRFIDTVRLRSKGCLWLGGVGAMTWPEPRRLLAVTSDVVLIDPVRRRVLGRSSLPAGQLVGVAKAGDGLVLLVASGGLGQLAVVDARGAVRSAPLELAVGIQPRDATFVRAGLAVDPTGRRAFVVSAVGPVAEVALDTLAVEYRELHEKVSLLGRLSAWLQPAAEAKTLPGTSRTAVWLGNGTLAVAGNRGAGDREEPAGLTLVDTRT